MSGGATTYRAEIERDGTSLNRRQVVPMAQTLAGTNPRNPLQAGLGGTFVVTGNSLVTTVIGTMTYMPDTAQAQSKSITFAKDANAFRWTAEGAIGGSNLGFPEDLDYDTPQPFEFTIKVVFRGGSQTRAYGFWVANGEISGCDTCYTRDSFSAVLQNCCYNQRGFRANDLIVPSTGGSGPGLFGEFGEWDAFFSPADYPTWAIGLGNSGSPPLENICRPNRDLLNPYLPDSITGEDNDRLDNPFIGRVVTPTTRTRTEQLDVFQLLEPIDGTAGETGLTVGDINPGADTLGNPYMDPPGFHRSSPLLIGPGPRPTSYGNNQVTRALVALQWTNGLSTIEASIGATTTPSISATLSGFDNGDDLYLFASVAPATFAGPVPNGVNPPLVFPPLGITTAFVPPQHLIEPRVTNGVSGSGIVNHYHNFGLAGTVVAISGGTTWNTAAIGAQYQLTPATFATSVTVDIPIDQTFLGAALTSLVAQSNAPDGIVTLFLQGIVCRPGTQPITDTTATSTFNVMWPADSFLTNLAALRFRA